MNIEFNETVESSLKSTCLSVAFVDLGKNCDSKFTQRCLEFFKIHIEFIPLFAFVVTQYI